ncbi:MAG: type I-E CRISPR-associated protein Cse2/CasB [Propionivibrio sp.]|uniref:type I-E CRISPR-associated protein Cse2/CasB n=1 Tax=Propionivibrio sp. TaxID=2212460 RepID=UPI0025F2C7E3|nr:type I-E CRISPR-associated protein Cse2/CasB [Propionivibrio sp.]MBK8895261.1 type I-E CRISPR-associated protein Cse2/CasB [Propionivibrio sp.]
MSTFIEWLEGLNEKDTKVRAVLRRSLAFDPGSYVHAFPYVEPFVGNGDNARRRETLYLVAGLWAAHWRENERGQPMPLGKACATHQIASGSTSTERRFITLLDADRDQLPHRLRQIIAMLKERSIDFEALLNGLLYWDDEQKRTQNAWARDFYRNLNHETETENQTEQEIAE